MKTVVFAALALIAPVAAHAADAGAGKAVFTQCTACHAYKPGAVGVAAPNLYGVVGRKAASTSFSYSAALKASKLTWDAATLNTFLKAPGKLVPVVPYSPRTPSGASGLGSNVSCCEGPPD